MRASELLDARRAVCGLGPGHVFALPVLASQLGTPIYTPYLACLLYATRSRSCFASAETRRHCRFAAIFGGVIFFCCEFTGWLVDR